MQSLSLSILPVAKAPSHPEVGVLVKTVGDRPGILWCIASVGLSLSDESYRLYIADEEPLPEWKTRLYELLQQMGHLVTVSPLSESVTVARNRLTDLLNTEDYVLRCDDDFELGGEFSLSSLRAVLDNVSDVGFCADIERQIGDGKSRKSGQLRIASGMIRFSHGGPQIIDLRPDASWKFEATSGGVRFARAGYTRNLLLLARDSANRVRWNEGLWFAGEHADFLLRLRKAGVQGAFTPDSIHLHRHDLKRFAGTSPLRSKVKPRIEKRIVDDRSIMRRVYAEDWGGLVVNAARVSYLGRVRRRLSRALYSNN